MGGLGPWFSEETETAGHQDLGFRSQHSSSTSPSPPAAWPWPGPYHSGPPLPHLRKGGIDRQWYSKPLKAGRSCFYVKSYLGPLGRLKWRRGGVWVPEPQLLGYFAHLHLKKPSGSVKHRRKSIVWIDFFPNEDLKSGSAASESSGSLLKREREILGPGRSTVESGNLLANPTPPPSTATLVMAES